MMIPQNRTALVTLTKAQRGVTIFELILIICIAGIIIALSLNQYFVYEKQTEFDNLKANIDIIFRAMQNYHQANCQLLQDYSGNPTSSSTNGLLDPSNTAAFPEGAPAAGKSVKIDLAGYLSRTINQVPLIDPSVGYVTQFNLVTQSRTAESINGTKSIGTIYLWKAQVAVKILDVDRITEYKNILGADCISDLQSTIVTPCESSPSGGSYLVWERLPSFASPSSIPPTWLTGPLLKEFKDQYTHDTFYEMNNNGANEAGPSNYLCGG
jgi:Tfp pilus assembly protein PilE